MVFTGSAEEESMAMGPERSKPLHNFMLPCLKWGSQRYLRCMKVATDAGDGRSPPSTRKRELESPPNNARDSDNTRTRITKPRIHADDDGIDAVREKLMLDLKTEADRMKDAILGKEVAAENDEDDEEEDEVVVAAAAAVTVAEAGERSAAVPVTAAGERPWNLRARNKGHVGVESGKGLKIEEKKTNSSSPSRTVIGALKLRGSPENMEKVKFSVQLSKKEIEEDFMQLFGHRPPRRPKKRPRNVQKQLDTLFPGLWLSEVTADSYKVHETPDNGKR